MTLLLKRLKYSVIALFFITTLFTFNVQDVLADPSRNLVEGLEASFWEVAKLQFASLAQALEYPVITLFFTVIIFAFSAQKALAHRPHDVIEALEISPNYIKDKTLFIVVREKLLKSIDGGASWNRIVRGIDNKHRLSALSISPQNSQIIFASSLGDGVYKSENAGNSWVKVTNNLENLNIGLLWVSPASSDVVFAAGREKGLYKTENGGGEWFEALDTGCRITALSFLPDKIDWILVGDSEGVVWTSGDGGKTWKSSLTLKQSGAVTAISANPNFSDNCVIFLGTEKNGVLRANLAQEDSNSLSLLPINSAQAINRPLSSQHIKNFAVSVHNTNVSTLSQSDGKEFTIFTSTWEGGVFCSKNGTSSWKKLSRGLTKDSQADDPKFNSPHFSILKLSRDFESDKTMFLAGFDGLFKSIDGGRQWKKLETLSTRVMTSLAISPDYQNDSTIAVGTYEREGYLSTDKGTTWHDITSGLEVPRYKKNKEKSLIVERPRYFEIAFSPNYSSDKTIFSSLIYRFVKSTDRGRHWTRIPLPKVPNDAPRDILIAISPTFAKDKTMYLGTYKGTIYQSANNGSKFSVCGKVGHQIRSLDISPNFANDRTLYAAGPKGVYRTINGGKDWQACFSEPSWQEYNCLQVAISPDYKADRTVFVATRNGLLRTKDGGDNWSQLTEQAYGKDAFVESVAISPNYTIDRTIVISVRGRGLFKSLDGGTTFALIGKDLIEKNYTASKMVMSTSVPIKFSPCYAVDRTLYCFGSAQLELLKSTDGGTTWDILPIARNEKKIDSVITALKVANLFLSARPKLKFALATIGALLGCLMLGYMGTLLFR